MKHLSLAYDIHSKYLNEYFESSKRILQIIVNDYLEDFLDSSEHIYQIIMNNYFDGLIKGLNRTSQMIMENSNLVKTAAALVTASFVTVSIMVYSWYYITNKNKIKTSKIDNEDKIFSVLEKDFNESTISTISVDDNLTETLRTFSQEKIKEGGSLTKTLGTPFTPEKIHQENDNHFLANDSTPETASQEIHHRMVIQSEPEASGVQPKSYKDPKASSQESDSNPSANDSTRLTENQETYHNVIIQSNVHEPETNVQIKSYEEVPSQESPLANDSTGLTLPSETESQELTSETISQEICHKMVIQSDVEAKPKSYEEIQEKISRIPKTDPPIIQTGSKYTDEPKTESESEVSSQSGLSDIDDENVDSTSTETEDTCVQTESQISRSIILNDQIPVIMPLPNETALDVLDEFRLSTGIYAFSGQDLIDLEDYDEEEEIRRFLFKKNF